MTVCSARNHNAGSDDGFDIEAADFFQLGRTCVSSQPGTLPLQPGTRFAGLLAGALQGFTLDLFKSGTELPNQAKQPNAPVFEISSLGEALCIYQPWPLAHAQESIPA